MTLPANQISTSCCIVGGGPAGMMLGFLLARAGVNVIVLEKHKDFLRDFRGDTIHPSTLQLMSELQLLDDFLKLPHQEITQLTAQVGDEVIPLADFSHLPTLCKFIAFMPQWDFLNFLADRAVAFPTFQLRMKAEVTDLLLTNGRVNGVIASTDSGRLEITAQLTVAADGRHSIVRKLAGLTIRELGAPIDVLWFRIRRKADDPRQVFGRFAAGKVMVMLNRGDYWQCGFVISKGDFDNLKRRGMKEFQQDIVPLAPFLSDRVSELKDWDEVRLLTVAVDRLLKWYREGLLCIGDAAHAMSPIGGVGINLAIQDAVAAANILHSILLNGVVTTADLARVQQRRLWPTRVTQGAQVFIQKRVLAPALQNQQRTTVPWFLRLFKHFPVLRRIPAYLVGVGARAEHIKT